MRIVCLVNRGAGLKPDQTTTALLLAASREEGAAAYVCGLDDVSLDLDGRVSFNARPVKHEPDPKVAVKELKKVPKVRVTDADLDVLLIRTNPGRDKSRFVLHEATLNLCRIAKHNGLLVLNDPDALPKASDKLFLAYLPEKLRPRMLVSRDSKLLRAFVDEEKGRSVLKPLFGTQGRGVFRVGGGGSNLGALIEVLTAEGFVIAQEYLRRAPEGDTRVILVDGEVLAVDGKYCAVKRVPTKEGEFRSNVHLGGRASPGEPTPPLLRAAAAVGEVLREHGIWMAGVDMVGSKAVEVNVRSPGGVVDAGEFEGVDFVAAILTSIERQLTSSGR